MTPRPLAGLFLRPVFPALPQWARQVAARMANGGGVLLGETAVLSTCVHVLSSGKPGYVTILQDFDAGRVFYERSDSGQVYHLDIFHADADVDHRRVANSLLVSLERHGREFGAGSPIGHYVDIQTATGGGRITGSLTYGQGDTLRQAHRHHIHLAFLAPTEHPSLPFYFVAGAEAALAEQGVELRKIDGLILTAGGGAGKGLSLADYATPSDSWLGTTGDQGRPERTGAPAPDGLRGRHGEVDRTTGRADGRGYPGAGKAEPKDTAARDAALHRQAMALALTFDSPNLVLELLSALAVGSRRRDVDQRFAVRAGADEMMSALNRLTAGGYLQQRGQGVIALTDLGRELHTYFGQHRREIQIALQKALRRVTHHHLRRSGRSPLPGTGRDDQGLLRRRQALQPEAGEQLHGIAWPETIAAAAARRGVPLPIQDYDLRVRQRVRRRPVDICLLVDASASMCGERMQAAKTLVRHLLSATRDKVAVIVFQERQVRVTVPFTRSVARVEEGLASIRPYGLTPLATGLDLAADYLRQSRPRNPLLILITDGIPTVPHRGKNPMEDALRAAAQWRQMRVSFTCVGLQPNKRYLADLVQIAGGSLHVVAELDAATLVTIATAERQRRATKARR